MAYHVGLRGCSADQIEQATTMALRTCRHMPRPVELRELCGESKHSDRAMLAWTVVDETIRRYGGYRSPDFDDGTINATIRNLGGWERLCSSAADEVDRYVRPQFLKTYESLSRLSVCGDRLVGICERENHANGLQRVKELVRIETKFSWVSQRQSLVPVSNLPTLTFKKP